MSRIKVIPPVEAEGRLAEIYDELIKSRGKIADIHSIQSLRPESIVKHMDLYMEIMYLKSDLSRAQREMMAVVVSVNNNCNYCQIHHGEALLNYWKDEEKLERFKKDFNSADLSEKDLTLCKYAKVITLNPGDSLKNDHTESLKKQGFSDGAILDATLVIAYFNFVNRIVLSLGVHLEEDGGKGYEY